MNLPSSSYSDWLTLVKGSVFTATKGLKSCYVSNPNLLLLFSSNPFVYKLALFKGLNTLLIKNSSVAAYTNFYENFYREDLSSLNPLSRYSNILPHSLFKFTITKGLSDSAVLQKFIPVPAQ